MYSYLSASKMPLTAGPGITIMKMVFSIPDTSVIIYALPDLQKIQIMER